MSWQKNARFKGGRGLRVKPGERNETEAAYEREYLEVEKQQGKILAFWFQEIKFKIGADCWWTPDWVVLYANGCLGIRELKGTTKIKKAGVDPKTRLGSKPFVEGQARVKIAAVATKFPLQVLIVFKLRGYEGGTWSHEDHTVWTETAVETSPAPAPGSEGGPAQLDLFAAGTPR